MNYLAGYIALVLVAFLIGSIPVGVLAGRARGVNIRAQGSGNIGATNALRVMGWKVGVAVLLADICKGVGPVLVARYVTGNDPMWVTATGLAAVIGHCFSPFLCFSGGKGVATAFGMILALDWRVGLIAAGVFLALMVIWRYVSLGSIVAAGLLWLIALALKLPAAMVVGFALIGALVIQRHHSNIGRLLAGTESKFGQKKAVESADREPPDSRASEDGETLG